MDSGLSEYYDNKLNIDRIIVVSLLSFDIKIILSVFLNDLQMNCKLQIFFVSSDSPRRCSG